MLCSYAFYYTSICEKWKGAFAMKIVLLNERQAEAVYCGQMMRDFPESELKPFATILGMMRGGIYEPLAFYEEDGTLTAYAW